MFCNKCGTKLGHDNQFCDSCGAKVAGGVNAPTNLKTPKKQNPTKDYCKENKQKKSSSSFNPRVIDFLEKNKNKTMIGFYWSLLWRFFVTVYGTIIIIAIIITLFE